MVASFSASLQVSTHDTFFSAGGSASVGVSASSKYSIVANSMKITSLGFGLGLNSERSDTMVAASLEEYLNLSRKMRIVTILGWYMG